jgi:hypothetical protein
VLAAVSRMTDPWDVGLRIKSLRKGLSSTNRGRGRDPQEKRADRVIDPARQASGAVPIMLNLAF